MPSAIVKGASQYSYPSAAWRVLQDTLTLASQSGQHVTCLWANTRCGAQGHQQTALANGSAALKCMAAMYGIWHAASHMAGNMVYLRAGEVQGGVPQSLPCTSRTWQRRVMSLQHGHAAVAAAAVVPDAAAAGCDERVVVVRVALRHRRQDPLGARLPGGPLGVGPGGGCAGGAAFCARLQQCNLPAGVREAVW